MRYRSFVVISSALLLSACSRLSTERAIEIPFVLNFHNQTIACGNAIDGLALKDFRFYLHNVEFQTRDGQWQALTLASDSRWQDGTTALIDFEDASAGCELGNPAVNSVVKGHLKPGDYSAMRFTIGVPFAANHQNPLTAKAPLNESSMHWHWQSGYKFVRAEFNYHDQSRRVHLGSLQCIGEIDNITQCKQPNRPTITLEHFIPGVNAVAISLDELFASNTELQSKLTCMGDDENPWCRSALNWLGLNGDKGHGFGITTAVKAPKER